MNKIYKTSNQNNTVTRNCPSKLFQPLAQNQKIFVIFMPFYLELFARFGDVKLSINDEHKVKHRMSIDKHRIAVCSDCSVNLLIIKFKYDYGIYFL